MNHEQIMGGNDDSEYSTSPPTRSRRPTISYAQATKRLSFQNETIIAQTPHVNTTNATQTMTTTMSTLTQSSLNDAIASLRKETEKSINDLRDEIKAEVKGMENNIATAVIMAMRQNNLSNMEVENLEAASMDSSQTATTTKSVMDQLDSLTQIVQLLAKKVQDIATIQEDNANKRARSLEPTIRNILQSLPNQEKDKDSGTRSPPAKLPRPTARTPPPKPPPPPNGIPKSTGNRDPGGKLMSSHKYHHLDSSTTKNKTKGINYKTHNKKSTDSEQPQYLQNLKTTQQKEQQHKKKEPTE
jgi:hypothetical protein